MSKIIKNTIVNSFDRSKPLHLSGSTNSNGFDSGELIVSGGVGIAKDLNINGKLKAKLIETNNLFIDGINIKDFCNNKEQKKVTKIGISELLLSEPVIGFGYFIAIIPKQPKINTLYINVNNNKIYYYDSKWHEIINVDKRVISINTVTLNNITYIINNIYSFNGTEWNIEHELVDGLSVYVRYGSIFKNQMIAYVTNRWCDIGYTTNHNNMENVGKINHNEIDKHILNNNIHKVYNQDLNTSSNVVFNSIECLNFSNNQNSLIRKKEFDENMLNIINKLNDDKFQICKLIDENSDIANKINFINQEEIKKLHNITDNIEKNIDNIKVTCDNQALNNKQELNKVLTNITEKVANQFTENKNLLTKLTDTNKQEFNNSMIKNNEIIDTKYSQNMEIINNKMEMMQKGVQNIVNETKNEIEKMINIIKINNDDLINKNDLKESIKYIENNINEQGKFKKIENQKKDKTINMSLYINQNLIVKNCILIDSNLQSNTYNEGSLIVKGGIGIDGNININGDIISSKNIYSDKITINELQIDKNVICNCKFITKNIECNCIETKNIKSETININGNINCKNIKSDDITTSNIMGNNLIVNGNGNFESIIIGKEGNTKYNLIIYGNNIVHNDETIDKVLTVKQTLKLHNSSTFGIEFYKSTLDKKFTSIKTDNNYNLIINPINEVIINGNVNVKRIKCFNPPVENTDVVRLCDLNNINILNKNINNENNENNKNNETNITQEILINYSDNNSIIFYNDDKQIIDIKNIENITNDKLILNFYKINNNINLNIPNFSIYLIQNIRIFKILTKIKPEFIPKFNVSLNLLLSDDIFKNYVNIKLTLSKNGILTGIIYGNYKYNKKYSSIRSCYEKDDDDLNSEFLLHYIS